METKYNAEHVEVNSLDDSLDRVTSEEKVENDARIHALTPQEQKSVVRRIDVRLVLYVTLIEPVRLNAIEKTY